jgi:RNA polymerase sigma-70 factor (ECF subfamily)
MTNPQVESLLEHDAFLRAMARRLLGDDAAADDIVQDAWVVALKSAKRPEEVRAGWLAGIVKNLVRRARRDHERRSRRERTAARRSAVGPTDEACAERAMRRRIVEIVVALPDIYREPLLLRYYDGLSPQAISERLHLPGSTVRTRIQRGLARVRATLENGNGNGHAFSLATLAAIAASRPRRRLLPAAAVAATLLVTALLVRPVPPGPLHVASEGRATAPAALAARLAAAQDEVAASASLAPASGSASASLLLHGVVRLPEGAVERSVRLDLDGGLSTNVEGDAPFTLDVSRIARDGLVHVRASHPESEPREVTAPVPGSMEIVLRRRALVPLEEILPAGTGVEGEALAGGEEGAGGAADRARKGTRLEGVVRLPLGASAAPVLIEAWRSGGEKVRTCARGGERFSLGVDALLADPLPQELRVRASHPDAAPRETKVPVLFDPKTGAPVVPFVEIELFAAAYLSGVVELEGVGPASDVTVVVFPEGGDEMAAAARTGPDGRFRIAVDRGASYLVAAAAPAYAPAGQTAFASRDVALPSLVLRGGVAIEGSVRSGTEPAAHATVRASLATAGGRSLPLGVEGRAIRVDAMGVAWESAPAETDAFGQFSIGGLDARTYKVEVQALASGEAPSYAPVVVEAPGKAAFDVPFVEVAVLVRGDGAPLPGAVVDVKGEDGPRVAKVVSGRATFLARPGETIHLAATAPGYRPEERDLRATAGETVFDLVPEAGFATLVVTFQSADGVPLPSACDFALEPDGGFPSERHVVVDGGRFVLSDLAPDTYRIVATLPGNFAPVSARMTLRAGVLEKLPLEVEALGRIVLRVLTSGAMPDVWVEGDLGRRAATAEPVRWQVTGDTMESDLLPPGQYVLHVLANGVTRSYPVLVKPAETLRLLVPLD